MNQQLSAYYGAVASLIEDLDEATGLAWVHESTGGGHDCLMAAVHFSRYLMLTSDACVYEVGKDTEATLGLYNSDDEYTDLESFGSDLPGAPVLELSDLLEGVVSTLKSWEII